MIKTEIDNVRTNDEVIHVVTHSMGGIILRYIQQTDPIQNLGKVVMLSPPNQGSEVVDVLGDRKLFKLLNGPAGQQLGTNADGIVHSLGDADFELGIIAGDRSVNPVLSMMIPGKDDGKVSIERSKLKGMKSFKVVHASHTFIMKNNLVGQCVVSFLKSGAFE